MIVELFFQGYALEDISLATGVELSIVEGICSDVTDTLGE